MRIENFGVGYSTHMIPTFWMDPLQACKVLGIVGQWSQILLGKRFPALAHWLTGFGGAYVLKRPLKLFGPK